MSDEDQKLMAYIDDEVRAVCKAKGWVPQIRRKWTVREKPVKESSIEDFEWKLIPDVHAMRRDGKPDDFEGIYYLVSFDKSRGFLLQHDTFHEGMLGPHWEVETYTSVSPSGTLEGHPAYTAPGDPPPVGWLRSHLLELITRFGPNRFCDT